jgi:hypothetical protein
VLELVQVHSQPGWVISNFFPYQSRTGLSTALALPIRT